MSKLLSKLDSKIILGLIFTLALFLRIYNLDKNPPSLNWDEVSHGYNAYSILITGKDEWGVFLPWSNIRAYGDYPLPVYTYLTIPWIALFGLNEFAIRVTSAIFGSLLTFSTYFLSKKILKSEIFGLIGAFLMALSPWSLMLSRQVTQSIPAISLASFGLLFFLKGIGGKKRWIITGSILMGLSAYAYHNTRILVPVLFLILIILFRKFFLQNKKILVATLIIGAVFFLPLVFVLTSKEGTARSAWVGILDSGAINYLNDSRGKSNLPEVVAKFIYNKPVYFGFKAVSNYLGYFNPIYLGFEGGSQYQLSLPHFGLIYPVELPFFYVGLIYLIWRFRKADNFNKFILIWLILAPIPAAVTRDAYHVGKSSTMLPVLTIVTLIGLSLTINYLKKNLTNLVTFVWLLFFLGVGITFVIYQINYYVDYPRDYSFSWQYGYRQVVEYVNKETSHYNKVVFTKKYGEPHEYFLFYSKYNSELYRNDPKLIRYEKTNWFWVDGFSKYVFMNEWEIKEKLKNETDVLLVTDPGNYPNGAKVLKRINFLNGQTAFEIVSI